jgi:hypothetical protein
MTNEQINIAIAEACPQLVEWHDGVPYHLGEWSAVGEGNEFYAEFRPATDLNAMHEAEKELTQEQEDKYVTTLCLDVQLEPRLHHATAQQRAEAFLKTIGKWEGGPQ